MAELMVKGLTSCEVFCCLFWSGLEGDSWKCVKNQKQTREHHVLEHSDVLSVEGFDFCKTIVNADFILGV